MKYFVAIGAFTLIAVYYLSPANSNSWSTRQKNVDFTEIYVEDKGIYFSISCNPPDSNQQVEVIEADVRSPNISFDNVEIYISNYENRIGVLSPYTRENETYTSSLNKNFASNFLQTLIKGGRIKLEAENGFSLDLEATSESRVIIENFSRKCMIF